MANRIFLSLRLKPVRDCFRTCRQRIAEILLHSNHERTGADKMAREVDLHPVHEIDHGNLARQADFSSARDNGLVPY
jgi:hypothetical protein